MRLMHCLDDLGVAIAQRIGGPTILKVDELITIHIPDEITFSPIDYDLRRRVIAFASTCF